MVSTFLMPQDYATLRCMVQYKNRIRTNTTPYIAYLCYMFISMCIRHPINRGQIVLCRTLHILRLCTCNVLDDYIPIFNVNNA